MFKSLQLSQLVKPLNARLIGADAEFSSLSSDSRKVASGQLFVALRGEFFDGHCFLSRLS